MANQEQDELDRTYFRRVADERRELEAQAWLRLMVKEAEGMPEEGMAKALERAEAAEALVEALVTDIGHWVKAYGPDLIVYPSKEEIRAVNKTPEFITGRNATMQVVSEGLQAILAEAQKGGD